MAFAAFLKHQGVPEGLWEKLADKVESGDVGFGDAAEVQLSDNGVPTAVKAAKELAAESDIFILPHVVATTRSKLPNFLSNQPELVEACKTIFKPALGDSPSDLPRLESEFWCWCRASVVPSESQADESMWHLEAPPLCWLQQAGAPNFKVVALPIQVGQEVGGKPGGYPAGVSVAWPCSKVAPGQPLTRDWAPTTKKTLGWALRLTSLLACPARWSEPKELEALQAATQQGLAGSSGSGGTLPGYGPLPSSCPHHDPRLPKGEVQAPTPPELPLVFTDYPLVKEALATSPPSPWAFTVSRGEAGVLFLVTPLKDFISNLSQLVNQFPYEGCLVRKDLLPQTARQAKYLATQQQAAAGSATSAAPSTAATCATSASGSPSSSHPAFPAWFPESYDLSSEGHLWWARQQQLQQAGVKPRWIVKLAGGSRSSDPCITADPLTVLKFTEAAGGDRVVQRYVDRPVLLSGGFKFDMRMYLLVKSLHPLQAYLHTAAGYARVAPQSYSQEPATLGEYQRHFTVVRYRPELGVEQQGLSVGEVAERLAQQGVNYSEVLGQVQGMCRELLQAAAGTIGCWPRSRGIYGLDILLEEDPSSSSKAQPKLLEVNFCGDLKPLLAYCPGFLNDAFQLLFSEGAGELPAGVVEITA